MDENLDRAAAESQGVSITSRGFDRGWFSSEGQHRIAVIDGELRELLRSFSTSADADDVPSLIIDTRLDHGLIPLSSLLESHGSQHQVACWNVTSTVLASDERPTHTSEL